MPYYTKNPVTVKARVLTELNVDEIAEWCDGYTNINDLTAEVTVEIPTLEGTMTARQGDYIIKGVKGEFYPCKPDIFHETYSETYHRGTTIIQVDDMVDHEDGSCTIGFTMDQRSLKLFAEVGMKKVLFDECNRILSENEEFDTNVGC
jgi:hypothetical protein